MRYIAFILSFPNCGSWNGKFTGEGNFYAITKKFYKVSDDDVNRILEHSSYSYNFGDGWVASIRTKEVTAKEVKQIKKNSKGFFGYSWMVDSIIKNDKIIYEKKS